jgi:hypothetical protein
MVPFINDVNFVVRTRRAMRIDPMTALRSE